MNDSFLKIVADDLVNRFGTELADIVVVFPNNRAKLFFNNFLAEKIGNIPFWSPTYTTIQSLFIQNSTFQIADSIYCVCKLYEIYSAVAQRELGESFLVESLDQFYFWGEMLLGDFEDIDNNLVDAQKLFRNISDLAEIEDNYEYLTETQRNALKEFFNNSKFSEEDNEEGIKHKFMQIWNLLYPIYSAFKEDLKNDNIAYEGMLKRAVIEQLKGIDYKDFKASKYLFVGFNVLNKCEEALFKHLDDCGKALFYWDYDDYYMKEGHEASVFMSKNIQKFPNAITFKKSYFTTTRPVKFISSSTENAQTKFLQEEINHWHKKGYKEKETAIVLCNESLLLPTLHSLPSTVTDVNITMGFPLIQTPIYATLKTLIEMQTCIQQSRSKHFSYKTISSVLNDSYIKTCFKDAAKLGKELKEKELYYPSLQEITYNEDLSLLFTCVKDPLTQSEEPQLTQWLVEILKKIAHSYQSNKEKEFEKSEQQQEIEDIYNDLYKEAIYRSYTAINRIYSLQKDGVLTVNFNTLTKLLNKVLTTISVPFTGEPIKGMQIMGFLETRNLDFSNIVMLSTNEGVVPRSGKENSFIPHNLRKGYGLTTIEHKNSLYAYYFYRLLQRAENITLIYNTSTEGTNRGQMSRFMMQMLADATFDVKFEDISFEDSFSITEKKNTSYIHKNKNITDYLIHKYITKRGKISPSALNTYIACPVRFYLSYVLNIKEERELDDEVDAPTFGEIFHNTMESIYQPYAGRGNICESDLSAIKRENIVQLVEKKFQERFYKSSPADFSGIQLVTINAMVEFVEKMVRFDKTHETPFQVIGLEKEVKTPIEINMADGKTITLEMEGRIDRIDKKGNYTIIKDYKTGGKQYSFPSIEELFEIGQSKYQYNRQILLYAYMYAKQEKLSDIKASIIYLNAEESKQECSFCDKNSGKDSATIDAYIEEIEENLKKVLTEIFNPDIPFDTTLTQADYCKYCPYIKVCPSPKM